jgi:hypothetical protein
MRGDEGKRRTELGGRRRCSLGSSSLMADKVDMEVGVEADIMDTTVMDITVIDTMVIDTIDYSCVDTA